jgi:RimJ/RimL family protein N-acetyltransferase
VDTARRRHGQRRWLTDEAVVTLRDARAADAADLARIDAKTWSPAGTPAPPDVATAERWRETLAEHEVLVAEVAGALAGYTVIGQTIKHLVTHAHVLEIKGLAVDPAHQGAGVGRALVLAACDRALQAGARKLSLRVLATNPAARHLYESCGFELEGVLRGEFLIDGALVDDVLMARDLTSE